MAGRRRPLGQAQDERLYSYGYGYPQLLPGGEIVLAGYRWDRSNSDGDFNIYNPQTLGAVPLETILFRSGDGGRTWSAPQAVPPPSGVPMANPTSRILSLSDGRLMLPIETWKTWDDPAPVRQRSMALFSRDGGRTWPEHVTVAADPSHRLIYWNGCFAALKDGRIYAMYWVKDTTTENDLPIRATCSEDQGQSWMEPIDTALIGQMGCCIDVGGGRVMAIFNRREQESPGIWAAVSPDGGRTWPQQGHALLWDACGRAVIGGAHQENRSRSIYDEGTIAFGKPDVIAAQDGTFLVGFWCTSNFVVHLRWASLSID